MAPDSVSALDCNRPAVLGAFAQQVEHRRVGRALDITAGTAFGAQVAIDPDQLAGADGVAGHATHGLAFEDVEVNLLVMGLGRDSACALRVPQDQVGVL